MKVAISEIKNLSKKIVLGNRLRAVSSNGVTVKGQGGGAK